MIRQSTMKDVHVQEIVNPEDSGHHPNRADEKLQECLSSVASIRTFSIPCNVSCGKLPRDQVGVTI